MGEETTRGDEERMGERMGEETTRVDEDRMGEEITRGEDDRSRLPYETMTGGDC